MGMGSNGSSCVLLTGWGRGAGILERGVWMWGDAAWASST
jgi:hypothetical protein